MPWLSVRLGRDPSRPPWTADVLIACQQVFADRVCSLEGGPNDMIFEQIATGGCQSYLVGCEATNAAVLIDPEFSRIDHYRGLLAQYGLSVKYVVDTHTHADHFSASRELGKALGAPVVMHRLAPAPYADLRLDDGDMLIVGELRLRALHTPGHTRDSMSLVLGDRVFTGDALLISGT